MYMRPALALEEPPGTVLGCYLDSVRAAQNHSQKPSYRSLSMLLVSLMLGSYFGGRPSTWSVIHHCQLFDFLPEHIVHLHVNYCTTNNSCLIHHLMHIYIYVGLLDQWTRYMWATLKEIF